ncbi:MAG: molybdopterin-dependent oxidoreductase, partial [Bryobacter sp.]|nr:molybdopterin-dependent oxidoreductase [Bryobacter sp.]
DAGIVHLLVSSTEIGQGAETVLAQIAADALGIDISRVVLETRDTHLVPDSGPTVASRTSMIVGGLVASAAAALRENLAVGGSRAECGYTKPEGLEWDDLRFRGSPYAGYSWAVDVAAVDVDPLSANISVRNVTAVIDAGTILNPVLAEGQVAGGIAQGVGMALCEETHWDRGRVANDRLSSYIIPTALDAPPVAVIFTDSPSGPKGLGELPLNGIAPAILNAVAAATSTDPRELPLTPERLLEFQEDPCNSTAK